MDLVLAFVLGSFISWILRGKVERSSQELFLGLARSLMAENRILVSRIQSMNMPSTLQEVAMAHEAIQPSDILMTPKEAASNLRAAFNG